MLPAEWEEILVPAPDQVFIRRKDVAETAGAGLIILPPSYTNVRKSSLATVVRVGAMVDPDLVGKRVVVKAGVGRKIAFGSRGESVLYVCRPAEMIGWVGETTEANDEGEREICGRFPAKPREDDGKIEESPTRAV